VSLYKDVLKADVSAPQDLPDHGVTTVFVNLPNTKIEVRGHVITSSMIRDILRPSLKLIESKIFESK